MHEKCYTRVPRQKRMAEGLYIEDGNLVAIYRGRGGSVGRRCRSSGT